ncbi:MAG: SPW repeat protein [Candidatus Bipolaricaulia bacterium]
MGDDLNPHERLRRDSSWLLRGLSKAGIGEVSLPWAAFAIGLWLVASPWGLGYREFSELALWHDSLMGVFVTVFAYMAVLAWQGERYFAVANLFNGFIGVWLVDSGIWLFGAEAPMIRWNELISGAIIAAVSFGAAWIEERGRGGI